jgi:hypothetical protein
LKLSGLNIGKILKQPETMGKLDMTASVNGTLGYRWKKFEAQVDVSDLAL